MATALIAKMTAADAPSPLVASASSQYNSTYVPWKAFDRDPKTWWLSSAAATRTLQIDLGSASVANYYWIEPDDQTSYAFAPTAWTFEGSNNASDWTELDSKSGISWAYTSNPRIVSVANTTAYRYYRLNITTSGTYAGIREFGVFNGLNTIYGGVWDGDSLGTDYGRTTGKRTTVAFLADPDRWMTAGFTNVAVPGHTITQRTAAAEAAVDSLLSGVSGYTHKYVIFQCGINDILGGASASTVRTRLESYISARISAGWDHVIVFTLTKAATVTGGSETERQSYNSGLLSSPPSNATVVDIASLDAFSNTGNTTYYLADGVHFTLDGCETVADSVFAAFPNVSAPTVTTTAASNETNTSFDAGGNVTDDGGDTVTARGIVWSTTVEEPTLEDCDGYTEDGTGTGAFTSSATGLPAGSSVNYAAYATNSVGTSYGSYETATTIAGDPYTDPVGAIAADGTTLTLTWMRAGGWPGDMDITASPCQISVDGVAVITEIGGSVSVDGETLTVTKYLPSTVYAGQVVTALDIEEGQAYSDGDPDNIRTAAVAEGTEITNGSEVPVPVSPTALLVLDLL